MLPTLLLLQLQAPDGVCSSIVLPLVSRGRPCANVVRPTHYWFKRQRIASSAGQINSACIIHGRVTCGSSACSAYHSRHPNSVIHSPFALQTGIPIDISPHPLQLQQLRRRNCRSLFQALGSLLYEQWCGFSNSSDYFSTILAFILFIFYHNNVKA